MATINNSGYLQRITKSGKNSNGRSTTRDWWLVKNGSVPISNIFVGIKNDGKRYKLKITLEEVGVEQPKEKQCIHCGKVIPDGDENCGECQIAKYKGEL